MPQVTSDDRAMFEAEGVLWGVSEQLFMLDRVGAWTKRISEVRDEVQKLATELRTYNDQFEEDE